MGQSEKLFHVRLMINISLIRILIKGQKDHSCYCCLIASLRCLLLYNSSITPQLMRCIFTSLLVLLNLETSERSTLSLISFYCMVTPIYFSTCWKISISLGVTKLIA